MRSPPPLLSPPSSRGPESSSSRRPPAGVPAAARAFFSGRLLPSSSALLDDASARSSLPPRRAMHGRRGSRARQRQRQHAHPVAPFSTAQSWKRPAVPTWVPAPDGCPPHARRAMHDSAATGRETKNLLRIRLRARLNRRLPWRFCLKGRGREFVRHKGPNHRQAACSTDHDLCSANHSRRRWHVKGLPIKRLAATVTSSRAAPCRRHSPLTTYLARNTAEAHVRHARLPAKSKNGSLSLPRFWLRSG